VAGSIACYAIANQAPASFFCNANAIVGNGEGKFTRENTQHMTEKADIFQTWCNISMNLKETKASLFNGRGKKAWETKEKTD